MAEHNSNFWIAADFNKAHSALVKAKHSVILTQNNKQTEHLPKATGWPDVVRLDGFSVREAVWERVCTTEVWGTFVGWQSLQKSCLCKAVLQSHCSCKMYLLGRVLFDLTWLVLECSEPSSEVAIVPFCRERKQVESSQVRHMCNFVWRVCQIARPSC